MPGVEEASRRRLRPPPERAHEYASNQFCETVIVSVREPVTACSVGSSHSAIVALWSGLKLPPLRSPSRTPSTDGGNDESSSPLTTAPASEPRSFTYSVLLRRPLFSALMAWSTLRG